MSKTNVPKIRFKDFTDAWEHQHLKKLTIIIKGEQLNKNLLKDRGKYYVLNGGMVPSGFTERFNTKGNTISISEGGNSCGYVSYNERDFWSGGHNYTLFQPKIDVRFLYQYLKGHEEYIMSLRVGSGLPNIQKASLSNFFINYPKEEKLQKEIGVFLNKIDLLITLHQRK